MWYQLDGYELLGVGVPGQLDSAVGSEADSDVFTLGALNELVDLLLQHFAK